jgi:uncharacterized SAM-binding protein YcdF (DUF218 family)
MGVIGRLIKWAFRLGVVVVALTVGVVLYLSDTNLQTHGRGPDAPVEAILVLGGGVDGDGVLGYSSRRRVVVAVAMLKGGQAQSLIFTGGPGWMTPGYTAAQLMQKHAISLGAAPDVLLTENRSTTTFENLRFGFALADKEGFTDLAILTDAFHLERAYWLAGYFGHQDIDLVAVRGLEYDGHANRVWSILREALAWWYNLAKVGGWEALSAAGMDVDAREELIK